MLRAKVVNLQAATQLTGGLLSYDYTRHANHLVFSFDLKGNTEQASLLSTIDCSQDSLQQLQMHARLSVLGEIEEQSAMAVWWKLTWYFYMINRSTLVYLSVLTLSIREEDSRRRLCHPDRWA